MKNIKDITKIKGIIADAENGDANSQAFLACSYFDGSFGEKNGRKVCCWAQHYIQNKSYCSPYDDYIHYILGRFKFEGKFMDYDLEEARQLLEKSYSAGYTKAGLYLCELVYPKYHLSQNFDRKRQLILNELIKDSDKKISRYAEYLLGVVNKWLV